SGRSVPASRRSRVVLPAPLGPTRPTRSPAYSSKPISSNRGPSSKPRDRLEQLNNSMLDTKKKPRTTRTTRKKKKKQNRGGPHLPGREINLGHFSSFLSCLCGFFFFLLFRVFGVFRG